jgi:uncharacterized protein YhbP (UPF0306 family)
MKVNLGYYEILMMSSKRIANKKYCTAWQALRQPAAAVFRCKPQGIKLLNTCIFFIAHLQFRLYLRNFYNTISFS